MNEWTNDRARRIATLHAVVCRWTNRHTTRCRERPANHELLLSWPSSDLSASGTRSDPRHRHTYIQTYTYIPIHTDTHTYKHTERHATLQRLTSSTFTTTNERRRQNVHLLWSFVPLALSSCPWVGSTCRLGHHWEVTCQGHVSRWLGTYGN